MNLKPQTFQTTNFSNFKPFKLFNQYFLLITYQQPVENLVKTCERNITTLFGNEKTVPAYSIR